MRLVIERHSLWIGLRAIFTATVAAGLLACAVEDLDGDGELSVEEDPPADVQVAPGWDEWMYTDDADSGGRVRFQRNGDVLELCDIEADGHGVRLDVYDYTAVKHKYHYFIGGNGRCQTLRASLGGRYDLAEGHVFQFRICLVKDGRASYCDTAYWEN